MSQEEAARVKKSILMKYPLSFLEECSRSLIGYKSYRDNKQWYRCLPIMATLIDYVTLDPDTRKRVYDLTDTERKNSRHHFIALPRDLVQDFIKIYYGPRNDGVMPLHFISPSKSVDPNRGIAIIRKPVNFLQAWEGYTPDTIVKMGGFYYMETYNIMTQMGPMPQQDFVPIIDFSPQNRKQLQHDLTTTIPFSYFTYLFDKGWLEVSPICTILEKLIAEALEGAGYDVSAAMSKAVEIGRVNPESEEGSLSL